MATGGQTENDCSLISVAEVTLQSSNENPWYRGIVVVSNNIFVIDSDDYKVCIHGLQDGRLLYKSDGLESEPMAVCIINDSEIAVILKNGLIKMFSSHTTPVIRWTMDLRVRGGLDRYTGVVSFNGDLVVCGVKENTVCWCIVSSNDGRVVGTIHQICKVKSSSSSFMTAKHNIIYISCDVQSPDTGVYGYDVQNPSKYKYIYKHKNLKYPKGIAIDQQGSLFVCNYYPYCIHHLTTECQLVSIVRQGIPRDPDTIFCDEGFLYVTSWLNNQITRYRIRYTASAGVMSSAPTSDTDRFKCIAYLLVDVGSRVLKQLLTHHTVTSTCTLDQYLAKHTSTINSLRRVFNQSQMDIMFPPNGADTNLDDYDITLLSALFQNIVPTLSQPEKDMIKRLREERNKLYGHAKSCQISAKDFQTYWNDISSTLTTLSQQCGDTAFEAKILQEIQRTKVSAIPAGSYLDILKTWFDMIESVKDELQNLTTRLQALQSRERSSATSLCLTQTGSLENLQVQGEPEVSQKGNLNAPIDQTAKDNLTEDKICHLLSSESDLKAYISDDPPSEACIKMLLSQASKEGSKESIKIILDFIVQQFTERFIEKHIRIWAGEKVIGPANVQTVFVCFYSGSCDVSLESFYDLKVIYRDYNTTDGESTSARAHELDIKSDLTPEQCDLVNEAITIHGEGLFAKHSNLEAISSSGILSSNSRGLVQEPCVILYCRVKGIIPFGEMLFPKRLKVNEEVSIAVDVREGYFSSHADSNPQPVNKFLTEPLRMGCSIGPVGRCESGTIGPFVKINSDRIGFLTCAHVVFCDSELINVANITQTYPVVKEIVQPPDGDLSAPHYQYNHRLCGRVFNAMFCGDWSPSSADKFGIDAAVIEITSRFPDKGAFVPIDESQLEDAGFSLEQPPKFDTGEMMPHPISRKIQTAVIKIGSETGLTRGLLRLTKGMVRYSTRSGTLKRDKERQEEITLTMHGLMEISSARFCTYGDSGAGVFLVDVDDDDNNKLICVGLSFGVLSDGTGLAMPIDKVLTALHCDDGLQIKLIDFENEEFI